MSINLVLKIDIHIAKGSTYGGVLVYDDGLFTYSNHATDPTCSKLCNAFDLLRIHLFGHLDEGFKQTTNIKYLPSFKAMNYWVYRNKKIDLREVESFAKYKSNIKYLSGAGKGACKTKRMRV